MASLIGPIQLLTSGDFIGFFAFFAAIVLAIAIHEFSHAYAAYKLGDSTPEREGRLTINPIKHLDLVGTILLLFIGFGWGKPVRFNPYNLKNQKWGPAIIAIAGPISNLILTVIFGLGFRFIQAQSGLNGTGLEEFLIYGFVLNVVLMVFNLIPVPPLDGSKILFAVVPGMKEESKLKLERYGPFFLLILLVFGGGIFSAVFGVVLQWFAALLGVGI